MNEKTCPKILLVSLRVEHSLDLDRQTEQVDKARAVLLIVNVVLAERSEVFAVQGVRRCYARVDDVALIEFELDIAGASITYTHDSNGTNPEIRSRATYSVLSARALMLHFTSVMTPCSISMQVMHRGWTQLPVL